MSRHGWILGLALALAATGAWAQQPSAGSGAPGAASRPAPAVPAKPSGAQAPTGQTPAGQAPAGQAASPSTSSQATTARRPRSYARCNRSARRNGLSGAERQRYVTRCRLGYDVPNFRP
jgi:hypothetical protein